MEQGKRPALDLRRLMPQVSAEVDRARQDHGAEWVNEQIRRGLAGEPDRFFAFEGGQLIGTPFKFDTMQRDDALRCAAFRASAFVALRRPEVAL